MDSISTGFIFDWDGVVIDSHAAHEESWGMLFDELGRPMPGDFFKKTFGIRNQQIIPAWFDFVHADDHREIARLGDRKEELYRDILRRDGIEPLPGVLALLQELKALGIPRAVGSSTPRLNIETVMEMAGLNGLFDAMVSAEDVTLGKPDPQVFLKAAQKIDRSPERCLVIEDAYVGIEAGKRAGMKVVAVATTHPLGSLKAADAAFANLAGLGAERMLESVGLIRTSKPQQSQA
ncbi:MAG: HAD family phosphatase [Verrucomicrobiaceae bacterium]